MLGVGIDPIGDPIHRLSWNGDVRNVIEQAGMSGRLSPLYEISTQSIVKRRGVSVWAYENQRPGLARAQIRQIQLT